MRAAVVQAPGDLAITELPDPAPRDHEVVVAVDTCGICGTDVHVLDGDYGVVRYPVIPGHEFGGEVVAVGRAVRGLAAGTRVAVDPMDYCDACSMCRSGWTNMCLDGGGLGTTAPGALAQYVAVNGARCEPLPDGLGLGEASLVEPLACVLHAVDRIGPVLGRDVLVLGAGPIGLLSLGPAGDVGWPGRSRSTGSRPGWPSARGSGPGGPAPRSGSWTAPGTWWWTPPAVPPRSPTDSRSPAGPAGSPCSASAARAGPSPSSRSTSWPASSPSSGSTRSGIPSAGRPGCSPRARCR